MALTMVNAVVLVKKLVDNSKLFGWLTVCLADWLAADSADVADDGNCGVIGAVTSDTDDG